MTTLLAFLRISRLEYLGAGIFFLFAVAAIGSGSWGRLYTELPWAALGAALWTCCHLLGSHVNCLADYELDQTFKRCLPRAIDQLGRRAVTMLVVVESVSALAISVVFCRRTGTLLPLELFLVGWVITLAYSVEPVRLKRRGFWSPIALVAVLYGLPISLGYTVLSDSTSWRAVGFLIAVGFQMFAVITVNSLEDIPEDRAAGVETPFVRHGLRAVANIVVASYALGAALSLVVLYLLSSRTAASLAVVAACGAAHLWVIAAMTAIRRHAAGAAVDLQFIRTAGGRNALQFAVLGATFGASAVVILMGRS